MAKRSAPPAVITRYCREYDEQESDVRAYILRQLGFFARIPDQGTDEAGWVALKLGATRADAARAIRWARNAEA